MTTMENIQWTLHLKHAMSLLNNTIRKHRCPLSHLKPKQSLTIRELVFNSHDVCALLPTGYGKSLTFELIPFINSNHGTPLIFCICPLDVIINEKLNNLKPYAQKMCKEFISSVQSSIDFNHFLYLIGHPEEFLTKEAMTLYGKDLFRERDVYIVVDEAHCAVTWGEEFRPMYRQIIKLRALFTKAKMLALTATATPSLRTSMMKMLGMCTGTVVAASVDRPNIHLSAWKRPPTTGSGHSVKDSYDFVIKPLLDELMLKQKDFPKTILYTKLEWCGYAHELALRPGRDGSRSAIRALVGQYHMPCTSQMKNSVAKSFASANGIRLLFATQAYSMGVDASDVIRILHAGPPRSMETYIQEIGRAGRNGDQAYGIIYYNNSDIAPNVMGMSDDIREYCKLESCRRDYICSLFDCMRGDTASDMCCDNCK